MERIIMHIDMNAFFASIEQHDDPALYGRPVAVTNGLTGTCIITCSRTAATPSAASRRGGRN